MKVWTRMWTALTLAAALVTGLAGTAAAQGVTTGSVSGTVSDAAGNPIEGATVKLTNASIGFTRSATTSAGGRYLFQSLEVGGGYAVSVAAIGYGPKTTRDVRVNLAGTTTVNVSLEKQTVQLEEIVATAPITAGEINAGRTAVQTVISDSLVARVPTLNRQLQDFVRLSPQVTTNPANSGALSAGGQNNRFNNIQVDGTTQTDRFGLGSSGELGGQAGGRGISLEAVKEYQIVLSPYNVTQGNFTGALVNAVTKNGTNEYKGTAFFTYREQSFAATPLRASPFDQSQFGGSIGGPIVKNKLFFFVAGEGQRANRPAGGSFLGGGSVIAPPVTQAQVDRFTQILSSYGINAGSAGAVSNGNPIANLVARLDWQASATTRLVFRNIWNDSKADDFSRGGTVFALTSNSFRRSERANSATLQVLSNYASGASNEFQVGYTRQRFRRAIPQRAPQISVQVPSATSAGAFATLRAGTENSSQGNELDQDLVELRNDYSFPINQRTQSHIVTIGTRNEFYKVRNAFLQNSFGNFTFNSLDSLANGLPVGYTVGLPRGGADPQARFSGATFGAYIQDQWTPTPRFNMTVGFRVDLPVFFDSPVTTPQVFSDVGRVTGNIPSWNPQFGPRVGFNWDAEGNQRTQVRGGVGVFGGNPAYVWLSNLFQNSGTGLAQLNCNATSGANTPPRFTTASVTTPPAVCGGGASLATNVGTVNTADPGLRLPQVLRASLGVDRVLPGGIVGTLEGLYTRSLSGLFYRNLNLRGPVGTGQAGRVLYGTLNASTGVPTVSVINSTYGAIGGGILDISNQGADYAYSISGSLRKRFSSSWEASAGYTYGRSFSVQDLTSSVALSNWRFGRIYSGLESSTDVGTSAFDIPHRFVATATYTAPWKKYPTDISVFYQGQSGTPYAYIYTGTGNRGDLNADGFNGNDPVYLPTDANDASQIQFQTFTAADGSTVTPAQQAAALNAFIGGIPCLNAQRGQIMRRNSCRNAFFHQLDVSVRQTLPQVAGQRLTLQADVFNFLNFLDRDWGKAKFANANTLTPGTNPQVNLLEHVAQAGTVPVVRFNPGLTPATQFQALTGAANFWQAQFTLRYAF